MDLPQDVVAHNKLMIAQKALGTVFLPAATAAGDIGPPELPPSCSVLSGGLLEPAIERHRWGPHLASGALSCEPCQIESGERQRSAAIGFVQAEDGAVRRHGQIGVA